MPVSPQDFELYSRMTGAPMPADAMSRMQMAPEVFKFTKDFAKKPNILEKTGNLVKTISTQAYGNRPRGIKAAPGGEYYVGSLEFGTATKCYHAACRFCGRSSCQSSACSHASCRHQRP